MSERPIRSDRSIATVCLIALLWLAGCGSQSPSPTPAPTPRPGPTSAATISPPTDQQILALPSAFRYEVTLRRAGVKDEPATVITGQYRDGAWSQSTRRGQDAPEELIVAPEGDGGLLHSYTRPAGEPAWTRWPGPGFDAGYGLASPFSVLRLYPLADERARGEADAVAGAPEATTKAQAVFSAPTVQRLLRAGVDAVATRAEERDALEAQMAPAVQSQTITFWTAQSGRIYRAAATLLNADQAGRPAPWLEAIWRFWGYDDPSITIAAPATYVDASALTGGSQPAPAASAEPALDPKTNLRVRAFALPGVPAENVTVTVYPGGKSQAAGTVNAADAQFALPPGTYDILVQAQKAEEWLKGVKVIAGSVASQDVVFDFGTLVLTVTQNGAMPKVDIVIYPAGQRKTFIDWRSENPTTLNLHAGKYDVEVALPDYTGTRSFAGIEVLARQTVTTTLDIGK